MKIEFEEEKPQSQTDAKNIFTVHFVLINKSNRMQRKILVPEIFGTN